MINEMKCLNIKEKNCYFDKIDGCKKISLKMN